VEAGEQVLADHAYALWFEPSLPWLTATNVFTALLVVKV
jgi:hypothetical protein